jgi:hypothetical protein
MIPFSLPVHFDFMRSVLKEDDDGQVLNNQTASTYF